MKRLLNTLVLFAVAIFGRMFLYGQMSGQHSDSSTAEAPAQSAGFVQTQVAPLMEKLAGAHFSTRDMAVIVGGTMIYSTVLGLVARVVCGDRVFGFRISGFIALMGAWAALLLYAEVFGQASPGSVGVIAAFAGVGSLISLIAAAAVKAFVSAEAETFMTGGETRIGAAVKRVAAPSSAKGPTNERMRAALGREPR